MVVQSGLSAVRNSTMVNGINLKFTTHKFTTKIFLPQFKIFILNTSFLWFGVVDIAYQQKKNKSHKASNKENYRKNFFPVLKIVFNA